MSLKDLKVTHKDTISMIKYLLCSQSWSQDYDFIIYIDCDILINTNSPSIHDYIDYEDRIGIVDEYTQPSLEIRKLIQMKFGWEKTPTEYYKLADFDIETNFMFNGGLFVMQPKIHKIFFESLYTKYVFHQINHPRKMHYEQACFGYELIKQNKYKIIDNKFNCIWLMYKVCNEKLQDVYNKNYFIHFAGKVDFDKIKDIKV